MYYENMGYPYYSVLAWDMKIYKQLERRVSRYTTRQDFLTLTKQLILLLRIRYQAFQRRMSYPVLLELY